MGQKPIVWGTHSLVISDIHCLIRRLGLFSRLRKTHWSSLVTDCPLWFESELSTVNAVWEMGCFEAGSRNNCSSAQMRIKTSSSHGAMQVWMVWLQKSFSRTNLLTTGIFWEIHTIGQKILKWSFRSLKRIDRLKDLLGQKILIHKFA